VTTSTFNPTQAMRTAIAVASATFHDEPDLARSLANDLDLPGARFALVVASECLALAVRSLAERSDTGAEHEWQQLCITTDEAIERAHARVKAEKATG
jgi:hypothetical protein